MRVLACPASLKGVLDASAPRTRCARGSGSPASAATRCRSPTAAEGRSTRSTRLAAASGTRRRSRTRSAGPERRAGCCSTTGRRSSRRPRRSRSIPAGSTSGTRPAAASACSCVRSAALAGSSSGSAGRRTWTRAPGCSTCWPHCPPPRWWRVTSTRRWSRRRGCSARRRGRLADDVAALEVRFAATGLPDVPGGGAAGGLGAALASLGAELRPGAPLVLDELGFDPPALRARRHRRGHGRSDDRPRQGAVGGRAPLCGRGCPLRRLRRARRGAAAGCGDCRALGRRGPRRRRPGRARPASWERPRSRVAASRATGAASTRSGRPTRRSAGTPRTSCRGSGAP